MYEIDGGVRERFLAKVQFGPDCWLWTASKSGNGYGLLRVKENGRWIRGLAHRIAYAVFVGTPPDDKVVMHTCDNRACVRPDHLRVGSQSENIRDMDAKGRRGERTYARGQRSGQAKLTDDAIRTILASYTGTYGDLSALARQFGVTAQAVRSVVRGEVWRHVERDDRAPVRLASLPKAHGERHNQAKLREEDVRAIRARYATGAASQRQLAADYGVSAASINLIIKRKTWTHVE